MYLLFDLGGTRSRFALTADGEKLEEIKIFDTPQEWSEVSSLLDQVKQDLLNGEGVDGVAGGIAGQVDSLGVLQMSPHISGWVGKNIRQAFENVFGVSVSIGNDNALAGLGEAILGAGKGKGIVAYIGIGTGVGGSRIVGGEIDKNAFGFEIGHHIMDACKGLSLEELVSGSAFQNIYGRKPRQDDTDLSAWREVGERMGEGFYNVALFWSPDVIVLGGTMMHRSPEVMTNTYQETFEKLMEKIDMPEVTLVLSEFEDESGLWGAATTVRKGGK